MPNPIVSEEDLICYAKSYLKERGFKKKGKRWIKLLDEFTLVFFIQGSQWCKDDYYIRPGVFINSIDTNACWSYYGHFYTEISPVFIEQIFSDLELFFEDWTDKTLVKNRVLAFIEWEKRNPLEARRAGAVNYEEDPAPSNILFATPQMVLDYVVCNF